MLALLGKRLAAQGAPRALLEKSLQKYMNEARIQQTITRMFHKFGCSVDVITSIGQVIDDNFQNKNIITQIAAMLNALAYEENEKVFGDAEILGPVLNLMKGFHQDVRKQSV